MVVASTYRIGSGYSRSLDAAGIADDALRSAFECCRRLHADFGRTYYLATLLLPPAKRPYVNSLYGFARYADEIVDNGAVETRSAALVGWSVQALADIRAGRSADPVCRALIHTVDRWGISVDYFEAFLRSMNMDLTVTEYATYSDLREYMYGSAAVIGLQMVPILEPVTVEAYERAAALGEAFQLTNFVRDIAEDLVRGRIYLPMEDLDAFGVTRESLLAGVVDRPFTELLKFEIDRIRRLYRYAEEGIAMLAPASRECIRTAFVLYSGILDEVVKRDYQILDRRVAVGIGRRLGVAVPGYLRARREWRSAGIGVGQAVRSREEN